MKKFLLSLILLTGSPAFATEGLAVNQFSGINTDEATVTLQDGQTPDSQNVVTDLGGLEGRKGFIQFSTQPAADLWQFPLSNGTRYIIKRSSNTLLADTGLGTFAITVSTIPTDRKTVVSVLGDKFFFMNTTDGLKYWNGSTVFTASATLTGTMLVTHKARLWEAGKTGEERYIRGSKLNDGTSWTAPTNPSDDDATILPISGALDENIQALYASFQDKLIWFKKSSFGAIFGSRRSNFTQRSFSETVGVSAPETIQDCDGALRWLGNNRKVWEFDGATYKKISDQVNGLFAGLLQGDSATRSAIITSQSDWDSGTYGNSVVPSGNLSSSISPGSVVLSTMAVIVSSDDTNTDFAAGTIVNLDSTTIPFGELMLPLNAESVVDQQYGVDTSYTVAFPAPSCGYAAQSFTATTSYFLTGVTLRLSKQNSFSDTIVSIYSDSGGNPGSPIVSGSILNSAVTTSPQDVTIPLTSTILIGGTRYWVEIPSSGGDGFGLRWWYTSGSFSEIFRGNNAGTCANVTTPNLKFKTNGKQYSQTGNFLSRTFDIGFSTNDWLFNLGILNADYSVPVGSTITFQTQTSADSSTFDSLVSVADGSTSTSVTRRYIRYKANFSTSYSTQTPMLGAVRIYDGPFLKSSGTYTSKLVTVGNNISAWGPVTIGNSVSSGGTETFQIGSTNTASASAISNWATITSNSIPTISTNPYVAFRSTFTATRATDTVQLNDFTFSWTDGSTLRSASGYIEQRYWLAASTSSATNNIVYVYDKKHQWQRYIGVNADCMGQYNSNLYFGNSSGIFQTEQGYTDAGTNITSYFKTKDYAPSGPDVFSSFNSVYMTTNQSDATLTTSFSMNGSTFSTSLGSYQMNQAGLLQNFKVPFSLTDTSIGKFLSLTWQMVGSSFWRIINADIYHTKGTEPE